MFNDKIMCIVSSPLLLHPPVRAAALLPVSGVAGVPHPGPARGAVPHPRHRVLVLTIYFLVLADIFPYTLHSAHLAVPVHATVRDLPEDVPGAAGAAVPRPGATCTHCTVLYPAIVLL